MNCTLWQVLHRFLMADERVELAGKPLKKRVFGAVVGDFAMNRANGLAIARL